MVHHQRGHARTWSDGRSREPSGGGRRFVQSGGRPPGNFSREPILVFDTGAPGAPGPFAGPADGAEAIRAEPAEARDAAIRAPRFGELLSAPGAPGKADRPQLTALRPGTIDLGRAGFVSRRRCALACAWHGFAGEGAEARRNTHSGRFPFEVLDPDRRKGLRLESVVAHQGREGGKLALVERRHIPLRPVVCVPWGIKEDRLALFVQRRCPGTVRDVRRFRHGPDEGYR